MLTFRLAWKSAEGVEFNTLTVSVPFMGVAVAEFEPISLLFSSYALTVNVTGFTEENACGYTLPDVNVWGAEPLTLSVTVKLEAEAPACPSNQVQETETELSAFAVATTSKYLGMSTGITLISVELSPSVPVNCKFPLNGGVAPLKTY
jgi:hypothetical protein